MDGRQPLDAELLMSGRDNSEGLTLRVWLRMSSCVAMIDDEIRRRLREQFDTTRPRFDFKAHLASARDGLTLGELSQRMMVSNGNMTGIAKRLIAEGLVERRAHVADKRITLVALTEKGAALHQEMASLYEDCINDMLAGLDDDDKQVLLTVLGMVRTSVVSRRSTATRS